MKCITRNDMKFGDYFIPARTEAMLASKPQYREANLPGMQLTIIVNLFDIHPDKKTGVPVMAVQIDDELEQERIGPTDSHMVGIAIHTHGDKVFLDAGDPFYKDSVLKKWQLEKVLGLAKFPPEILSEFCNDGILLQYVTEYLDDEFAKWVEENCHFRKLTKKDIENGECIDGAEPGDRTLSAKGLEQFEEKKLEYQKRLEITGFTYDFKGGLIWE